jgi:hypothetical protein
MSAREPMNDAALLALLRFDAARDAQPAAKARVLGRLAATIGAVGAAAASTSSAPFPGGGHSPADSALVSRVRASGMRSPLRATWGLAGKPLRTIAAAFLLGGAGGAGLHAAFAPPRQRTVYVEHPIAVSEPRPFAFGVPSRAAESADRDTEAPESPKGRGNPTPVVSALTAERALLDRARKALARGDSAEAGAALDLHARRHPMGLLGEEREALAIKVLVDLGRAEEARRRAGKFKERYPRSLFGPSVDEAIGTMR